jgi:uncharacterized protein with PQ loop repeat
MVQFKSKYTNWSEKISSKFPKLDVSPDTAQLYANMMIIVAFLGLIPVFMQCWKVYKSKDAKGISIYAFTFSICLSVLWTIYALIMRNGVQLVSSLLSIIAAATLIILSRRYRINSANLALVDGSI